MKTFTSLLAASALALFVTSCRADRGRSEFEQAFIGVEWTVPYLPSDSCEYLGGYLLPGQSEFAMSFHMCEGRRLELFERFVAPRKAKVLDALLLPKFVEGDDVMYVGECELRKKTDKFFFALVNLGKRESVNWKTGVKAAWIPNPKTGKIEELSTRHIVCFEPTPP